MGSYVIVELVQGKCDSPLVTIALSTIGCRTSSILDLIQSLNSQTEFNFDLLVVLQDPSGEKRNDVENLILSQCNGGYRVFLATSCTTGLLISRNIAIHLSSAKYVLLSDDDCVYSPSAMQMIGGFIRNSSEAEVYTFKSLCGDDAVDVISGNCFEISSHGLKSIMSVKSIEILINKKVLRLKSKIFDERFGLGTSFPTGGENIMLLDLYRLGCEIRSINFPIVSHKNISSGYASDDVGRLSYAKGAMFKRMFGGSGFFLFSFFCFYKRFVTREIKFSFLSFVQGCRGFIEGPGK